MGLVVSLKRGMGVRFLGRLVLAGVVVLLAGCAGGAGDSSSSTSASGIPESPSPTPSPGLGLDDDQQAAVHAVVEYFRVTQELQRDPSLPDDPLADITTGKAHKDDRYNRLQLIERGLYQRGEFSVTVHSAEDVKNPEGQPEVQVSVCTDSTQSNLISEKTGEPLEVEDRNFILDWKINVVLEDSKWKISKTYNKAVKSCP